MKVCKKCEKEKELTEFYKNSKSGNYLNVCKKCNNKSSSEYYIMNKDLMKEYKKNWRKNNIERILEKEQKRRDGFTVEEKESMKEYYKNPEVTQEVMLANGWIRSGDVGYEDETGNYFLVDRIKDLIIRGGRNIYPKEVEEVIMTHPAISMVAVIGIPDDKYGEEVKAYAVLKQGMAVTEAELMQWTKENIAGYKYPRYIQLVETLPMTASGKISKKDLKTLHKDTVNNN